jgi:glycosyltransferase involved in cell wall biosynthesis
MTTRPTFSIGVATYRRPQLLRETLDSVLGQTFEDFELLVGNDDPETTLTPLGLGLDDPRLRILNHHRNLGEVANMNALLAAARGHRFTWLADDDLYDLRFLEEVHAALGRYEYPRCVFTSYATGASYDGVNRSGDAVPRLLSSREFLTGYLSRSVHVLGCYGVFERGFLTSLGGMEHLGTGFSPYADNLLAMRAALAAPVLYIDRPLILFRTHSESISWTSPDLDAYRTAQEDLCERAVEVFAQVELDEAFDDCLFELLDFFCVRYYYVVARRAGSLKNLVLSRYLRFIARYARRMGRHRARLARSVARQTASLLYFIARRWGRSIAEPHGGGSGLPAERAAAAFRTDPDQGPELSDG